TAREVRLLAEDVGEEDEARALHRRTRALGHVLVLELADQDRPVSALLHLVVADAGLGDLPRDFLAVGLQGLEPPEDIRALAVALAGLLVLPVAAADDDEVARLRTAGAFGHLARQLAIHRDVRRRMLREDPQILAGPPLEPLSRRGTVHQGGVIAPEAPQQPVRQESAGGAGALAVVLRDVVEADLVPMAVAAHVRGVGQGLRAQGDGLGAWHDGPPLRNGMLPTAWPCSGAMFRGYVAPAPISFPSFHIDFSHSRYGGRLRPAPEGEWLGSRPHPRPPPREAGEGGWSNSPAGAGRPGCPAGPPRSRAARGGRSDRGRGGPAPGPAGSPGLTRRMPPGAAPGRA